MSVATARAARAAMKEKAQRLAKKSVGVKPKIDMGGMEAAEQGATTKAQKAYRTARKDGGKVHGKAAPKRADKVQRRIKKQDAGSVGLGANIVRALPSRYRSRITPEEADVLASSAMSSGATRAARPRPAATKPPSSTWTGEAFDPMQAAAPAAAPARVRAPRAAPAASSLPPPSTPVAAGYRALASQVPIGAYSGAGAAARPVSSGLPLAATAGAAGAGMLGLSAFQNAQREPEYMEATAPPPASALDYREATAPAPAARPASRPAAPAARQPTADELMDYYNIKGGRVGNEMAQLAAMRNRPEDAGPMKRGGAAKKKSAKKTAKGR